MLPRYVCRGLRQLTRQVRSGQPRELTGGGAQEGVVSQPFGADSTASSTTQTDIAIRPKRGLRGERLPTEADTAAALAFGASLLHVCDEAELKERFSHVIPAVPRYSYNLRPYVPRSEVLQQLLHLGVNLYQVEKHHEICSELLRLDWSRDCLPVVQLLQQHGFADDGIGRILTKSPEILTRPCGELAVVLEYLQSHGFTSARTVALVTECPAVLASACEDLDAQLDYFNREFHLTDARVVTAVCKCPRVLLQPAEKIKVVKLHLCSFLDLRQADVSAIFESCPGVLCMHHGAVMEKFHLLQNTMGIPSEIIVENPTVLMTSKQKLYNLSQYLEFKGRAQYDATKANYVPPAAFYELLERDFVPLYAKTDFAEYEMFLKTL